MTSTENKQEVASLVPAHLPPHAEEGDAGPVAEGSPECSPAAVEVECPARPPFPRDSAPFLREFAMISGAHTLPGPPRQVNNCHHDYKEKGKRRLMEVERPLERLQDNFRANSSAYLGAGAGRGEPRLGMAIKTRLEKSLKVLVALCRVS